jgi:hypothetical protein
MEHGACGMKKCLKLKGGLEGKRYIEGRKERVIEKKLLDYDKPVKTNQINDSDEPEESVEPDESDKSYNTRNIELGILNPDVC